MGKASGTTKQNAGTWQRSGNMFFCSPECVDNFNLRVVNEVKTDPTQMNEIPNGTQCAAPCCQVRFHPHLFD